MTILGLAPSYISLAICTWGFAHQPFERLAEGRLRVITHAPSNFINLGVGRAQQLHSFAETVALKVALGGRANARLKPGSEAGARQVRFICECAYRPGVFWPLMNQAEDASDGTISQDGGQALLSIGGGQDIIANGSKQKRFRKVRDDSLFTWAGVSQFRFDASQ